MTVQLFVPCFIDQLYPQVAFDTIKVLEKAGCTVKYNAQQTCCGQPAFNAGFWGESKDVCTKFVQDFEGARIASYLRSLANRRSTGVVTADDVHTYLTRDGVREQQTRTRLSFINSVFSSEMFEFAGMTASNRPAARGRAISAYTVA